MNIKNSIKQRQFQEYLEIKNKAKEFHKFVKEYGLKDSYNSDLGEDQANKHANALLGFDSYDNLKENE